GRPLPQALAARGPGSLRLRARLVGRTGGRGPATGRWADARLDGGGRFEPGRPLALHLDLDGDLGGLGRAMGGPTVEGRVRVAADAAGTLERPLITGRIETESLILDKQPIGRVELSARLEGTGGFTRWAGTLDAGRIGTPPAPVENLQAAFTFATDQLDLQKLTARVGRVPVNLRGTWGWTGTGRGQADLGPAPLAGLPGLPTDLALAGTGAGRVEITAGPRIEATAGGWVTDGGLHDGALRTGRLPGTPPRPRPRGRLSFPPTRPPAPARRRLPGRPLP